MSEASIGRVYSHTKNRNVGIITAHRGDYTSDEKLAANRNLEADIRQSGLGFIHVKGRYIEGKGTPKERIVDAEHSYLVTSDKNDGGKLKGFLKSNGAKYKQDSVLWKPHDRKNASFLYTSKVADRNPGDEENVGPFHPMRVGEYHSRLIHKKRDFSFAEEAEANVIEYSFWRNLSPISMGREKHAEF